MHHWFRSYVRLSCNYSTKIRKKDRNKISSNIILEAVRAVKIYNLSIRQVALGFHINYSGYYKKVLNITINLETCDNQP